MTLYTLAGRDACVCVYLQEFGGGVWVVDKDKKTI